jgi:peptidoglycan hydrolase CwlO-like protein
MKKIDLLAFLFTVVLFVSCNIPRNIEDKKEEENENFIELMERVQSTINYLDINLDRMIERIEENEKEIKKLKERINELEEQSNNKN